METLLRGALRAVLVCQLTDALGLALEESTWLAKQVDDVLVDLEHRPARAVPVAVVHEMHTGAFDSYLARLLEGQASLPPPLTAEETRRAPREVWADALTDTLTATFALSESEALPVRLRWDGLLADLGVGDRPEDRPCRYLPEDVLALLRSR